MPADIAPMRVDPSVDDDADAGATSTLAAHFGAGLSCAVETATWH